MHYSTTHNIIEVRNDKVSTRASSTSSKASRASAATCNNIFSHLSCKYAGGDSCNRSLWVMS